MNIHVRTQNRTRPLNQKTIESTSTPPFSPQPPFLCFRLREGKDLIFKPLLTNSFSFPKSVHFEEHWNGQLQWLTSALHFNLPSNPSNQMANRAFLHSPSSSIFHDVRLSWACFYGPCKLPQVLNPRMNILSYISNNFIKSPKPTI
jgi:hypothetical protein